MRPEQYDGSLRLTMTASEWRQDEEAHLAWTETSRGRVAAWRDAARGIASVTVVPDRDSSAGIYIAAATRDVAVVAAAGERIGCSWLERGGWPIGPDRRMVQVGEDLDDARAIARVLRADRPDLADAIAVRVRQLAAAQRRRPTVNHSTGAPHALAA